MKHVKSYVLILMTLKYILTWIYYDKFIYLISIKPIHYF